MEQECVVTALLQQNDALQKQLQELLAASAQQPAPATAVASPAAAAAAEAEGSTAPQQLTGNERRLVKLLKKMQKDKERWACTANKSAQQWAVQTTSVTAALCVLCHAGTLYLCAATASCALPVSVLVG
jgi:hypothetical protein